MHRIRMCSSIKEEARKGKFADVQEGKIEKKRENVNGEQRGRVAGLDETKKEARTRSMVRGSPFAASLTGATDLPEQK